MSRGTKEGLGAGGGRGIEEARHACTTEVGTGEVSASPWLKDRGRQSEGGAKRRMNDAEESDQGIVVMKPANKARGAG